MPRNVADLIDWFQFSLSDSDKLRVEQLDSTRNEDNENEINAEISQIYDKVSPFSFNQIAKMKGAKHGKHVSK